MSKSNTIAITRTGKIEESQLLKNKIKALAEEKKPLVQFSSFEKMEKLKAGIYKSDLENLKRYTGYTYDQLSNVLCVTKATLLNKNKAVKKFTTSLGERIIGLQEIYTLGYEVFGDENKFKKWMFLPNNALDGKMPFEILDNQFGRDEVKKLIGRIAYGVYS